MITKKHLPRRTFLRGLGVSLALPLLDGMVPAFAALRHDAAEPVKRFGAVYVPNGVEMRMWTPKGEGPGFELSPILEPLEPFRDQTFVLSGLADKVAVPLPGEGIGDHARASATWLTGVRVKKTEGPDIRAGVSMDQIGGAAPGEGDAAGVARAGAGLGRSAGGVRRRLQLRVCEHDCVADADDAAADGEQSAGGVRAAVRGERQHGPGDAAGAACSRTGAFSTS